MNAIQFTLDSPFRTSIHVSHFNPHPQKLEEFHLCIEAPSDGTFLEQLTAVERSYAFALDECSLDVDSVVFRRIFINDSANQLHLLEMSTLGEPSNETTVAISIIEQPPLAGRRLSLWAYHVRGGSPIVKRKVNHGVLLERRDARHLWTVGLSAPRSTGAFAQSHQVIRDLEIQLETLGGNLKDHAIRTWFYLYDIDGEYAALVEARKQRFLELGLGPDTHYLASTGIAGRLPSPHQRILLDAYAVVGLRATQQSFLSAPKHLGPTHLYGVTFERGTCVSYEDRKHLFLSGTASIDPLGNTLYVGDIHRQCGRALDNVEALLANAGGSLSSLAQLTAYVRQAADGPIVEAYLKNRCPTVPRVVVEAKVCRPNWLVEFEGIALIPNNDPALPEY